MKSNLKFMFFSDNLLVDNVYNYLKQNHTDLLSHFYREAENYPSLEYFSFYDDMKNTLKINNSILNRALLKIHEDYNLNVQLQTSGSTKDSL
jgi:hypothetical protein